MGTLVMHLKKITRDQALHAIEAGEFGADVTAGNKRIAVLMTQDWCPQWKAMQAWLNTLDVEFDLYELVYDQVEYFEDFKNFKETKWGNRQIPYVRYYLDGALAHESNYVEKEEFLKNLGY
jgi:glutaredoxin